jgi:hypothetical protein
VARQPAVEVSTSFSVTFDTFSHAPVFGRQALQVLDVAVTFLTSHFLVDVTLVVEQNVFGYIVNLDPWGRRSGIKVSMFFLDPGMISNNVVVAVQTFLHRREARKV